MKRSLGLIPVAFLLALACFGIVPRRRASAWAQNVAFLYTCNGGSVNMTVSWESDGLNAQRQWIDYSTTDSNWAPGSFQSAGPIAGDATRFTVMNLPADTSYVLRINEQLPDGSWRPTPTHHPATPCGEGHPLAGKVTILGFSNHVAPGNQPPSDMTLPDGTVNACRPSALYVFFSSADVADVTDMVARWYKNADAITPVVALGIKGSNTYAVRLVSNSLDSGGYSLKLTSGGETATQVDATASFKVAC